MFIRIDQLQQTLDADNADIAATILALLNITADQLIAWRISRRTIDARKKAALHFVLSIECQLHPHAKPDMSTGVLRIDHFSSTSIPPQGLKKRATHNKTSAIIVGAGPAGLFAALALADAGITVTLLERGKPVETRMRDIGALRSRGSLNTESNICFGEGGAGTYTDGKLYTRIKHPFVRWVLHEMVRFGANPDILVEAHPHLGTDKLLRLVRNIRNYLLDHGVDYRFDARVDDILTHNNQAIGVTLAKGDQLHADHIILAIGHSARDTFEQLQRSGIQMEAKDFAVGVRAEHAQAWVNQCQYGNSFANHPALSAAEYRLAHQVKTADGSDRGVYSFCMCPGGLIVPSPTEHGRLAINGMSNAKRSGKFANSGIVVQITQADMAQANLGKDALVGIRLQRQLEHKAYNMTRAPYQAPAMRITDFINNRASGTLASSSYKPGIEAHDLHELFPTWLSQPLKEGLRAFDRKMRGYVSDEANILGIESRTSSPIRMTRHNNMQSVSLERLYPVGEGAGYAGGIVSAAVDGLKAAEEILKQC
ncbi:MAG: NAD(P)/FAD-dependent oxidoreductase [Zetaproteobacteria bacterium]|nr:NAD(P)/FAD-dependent oxidoreductase [Zetaproteobacteria bacterium]